MDNDHTKTPSELADEARELGREAAESVQGYAAAAKQTADLAAQSIRPQIDEAARLGRDALADARSYARDAGQTAKAAVDAGRAYARDAVNAAGRKLEDLKSQAAEAKDKGARYVMDDPVRAVMFAVAGGALLTALFLAAMRSDRRRD